MFKYVYSPPGATNERERARKGDVAVDLRQTCEGKGGKRNGNNSTSVLAFLLNKNQRKRNYFIFLNNQKPNYRKFFKN
jgi:hypothetical protein